MTKTSLSAEALERATLPLKTANLTFAERYPGEPSGRQPVHTVYGGAHLFRADAAQKLGASAIRAFEEYAADHAVLASVLRLPGSGVPSSEIAALDAEGPKGQREDRATWLAKTIHARVLEKLRREPVEDLRIDFEDGYGARPNAEEDGHAASAALEVVKGMAQSSLPPFIGIRIKPLSEELRERSLRTLDIFLTTLVAESRGRLPDNFVVTLPKITVPEQVTALCDVFDALEPALGLPAGSLKLEFMIETTQTILDPSGRVALPHLLSLARGRCVAAHFGTYDYTASCNITAAHQHMTHPACDFARHLMQIAYSRTGIWLSDGATNIMPIPPHKPAKEGAPLTAQELAENRLTVHRAWKTQYDHIQHSLIHGFYQGWDLHPAQLSIRYAAVYAFFLDGLSLASARLSNFVEKAAQATLVGDVFDDAATGQGLLNFFLRAINSGAVTEAEAARLTALSLDELRGRSFVKILERRRG
jgi:citrate lyase beta subunit